MMSFSRALVFDVIAYKVCLIWSYNSGSSVVPRPRQLLVYIIADSYEQHLWKCFV